MPKRKRQKSQIPVISSAAGSRQAESERKGRLVAIIAGVFIVLILAAGIPIFYQSYLSPYKRPVITVDKTAVNMGYFLKRDKMSGSATNDLIKQLVDEQIVKEMAPGFGITVTESEIDDALLYRASSDNSSGNLGENMTGRYLTETEYKSWYREQLKNTKLSDVEFRDIARTNLLATKLLQFLAENIATSSQQVHLNIIIVANTADADKAKSRIQAGESFAAVAKQVSLDAASKANGGDIGWFPPGILPFDNTIFNLDTGIVSDPVQLTDSTQYALFMVSEKAANLDIDPNNLEMLKSRALLNWLAGEEPQHSIKINYDFNDAKNQAWISWQLSQK
jgi:foldase protein PrsA